jgi:hypothetical protein
MAAVVATEAKADKSVMSRLGPLTPAQRRDYLALVNGGIDPKTARAIVQSGVTKSADAPKARPTYHQAYVDHAKKTLPTWQHEQLHAQARSIAGGHASVVARNAPEPMEANKQELALLKDRMGYLEQEIAKGSMLASDVHVPVPLGDDGRKKVPVVLSAEDAMVAEAYDIVAKARVAQDDAEALAHIQAAYELTAPAEAYNPDQDKVPAGAEELIQANRLVAGMDAEMAAGATSPEDARKRASRALQDRPGIYDSVGATPQTDRLDGLMLDLGAGTARAPGFIGLDLGTFGDYGNAIHDCTLGLGEFPDGSVRAVRLVNALHDIVDTDAEDGDPTYLLQEIQRVLCEGGILTYVGPEPLFESDDAWPAPGLFLMGEQGVPASEADDGAGAVWQTFERVPPRVPAYHGADADYAPAGPMPIDMALAMAAYREAPARLAMANLVNKRVSRAEIVHKTASKVVRIAKADAAKQIIYGVVLEPFTPDLQGDILTPDDIEDAAHGFLGTSRIIGSEHGAPIEAYPVESFIAPQELVFDGPEGRSVVTKGSWVLGVKVNNPDEWAKVCQNDYNAFSVGGYGVREDIV